MNNDKLTIGFDMDGTLTIDRFDSIHEKVGNDEKVLKKHIGEMLDFRPSKYLDVLKSHLLVGDDVVIISFRRSEWEDISLKWLIKHGVDIDKLHWYFCPQELYTNVPDIYALSVIGFKASILNRLNVDIYYEDSDFIIDKVSPFVDTKIIKAISCYGNERIYEN